MFMPKASESDRGEAGGCPKKCVNSMNQLHLPVISVQHQPEQQCLQKN
jgi:hypothetical protein